MIVSNIRNECDVIPQKNDINDDSSNFGLE